MKVTKIRLFWKLAEWRDLKNKLFAGGRRPLERQNNPGTVSKSSRQHLDGHNHLPAAKVLKSQGWVNPAVQAVSNGNDTSHTTCMCICTFYRVVSHGKPGSRPNQIQILFDVVCDDNKGPEHRLPLVHHHLHLHRHRRSPSPVHHLIHTGFPINLIPLGKPACRQVKLIQKYFLRSN